MAHTDEEQRNGDFGRSTLLVESLQSRLQESQALVESIYLADNVETYSGSNLGQTLTKIVS